MQFDRKVEARRRAIASALCVGLDPEVDRLPESVSRNPAGVLAFVTAIVAATADLACAYKPNFAFYEALGPEGMALLRQIITRIPPGVPIIGDAKRSDIAHTARLYAKAAFEVYGCDALVVNPYQGQDSVEAYLAYPDRGVYVLARTSNSGAADFQERLVDGEPLYLRVVRLAQTWRAAGTLGFVVGATAPEQIQAVRRAAPAAPLLIPGIGAQGGDVQASLREGRRSDGGGVLVSASRSILYASRGRDFAEAARREAERLVTMMRQSALEGASSR